jgi:hypothetical protein
MRNINVGVNGDLSPAPPPQCSVARHVWGWYETHNKDKLLAIQWTAHLRTLADGGDNPFGYKPAQRNRWQIYAPFRCHAEGTSAVGLTLAAARALQIDGASNCLGADGRKENLESEHFH